LYEWLTVVLTSILIKTTGFNKTRDQGMRRYRSDLADAFPTPDPLLAAVTV
jgi:hypothetical protein